MTERTFTFSVSNLTTLGTFAANLSAGQLSEYTASLPSLNAVAASGSMPWDAPAGSGGDALLDWASMMEQDTTTKRYYISGGRPYQQPTPLKMVIFDEVANEIRARDQWSGGNCGHLYRSTTVIPAHRRVAYFPHGGPVPALMNIDTEVFSSNITNCPANIGGFSNGWNTSNVVWHPTLGTQGAIIWANNSRNRIAKFDWQTQTWSALGNYDGETWAPYFGCHYHPITGKAIVCASETTANAQGVIIDSAGTLTRTAAAPCATGPGGGSTSQNAQFFPHPTRDASISVCHTTNKFWTYEWSSNTWVDRGALPAELQSFLLIAAPTAWGALFFKYGANGASKAYAWKPGF